MIKSANACGIRISFRPDSLRMFAHCLESVRLYPAAMLCLCDGCSASQPNDPSNRYGNRCCSRDSSKRDWEKRILGRTVEITGRRPNNLTSRNARPVAPVHFLVMQHFAPAIGQLRQSVVDCRCSRRQSPDRGVRIGLDSSVAQDFEHSFCEGSKIVF